MVKIQVIRKNTNPKIMGWLVDEYEKVTKNKSRAVITGKAIEDYRRIQGFKEQTGMDNPYRCSGFAARLETPGAA